MTYARGLVMTSCLFVFLPVTLSITRHAFTETPPYALTLLHATSLINPTTAFYLTSSRVQIRNIGPSASFVWK